MDREGLLELQRVLPLVRLGIEQIVERMVEGLLALLAARLLVDLGRHRRHGFHDAARAGEEGRDVKRPLPADGDAGARLISPEQAGPERRDLAPGEAVGALELAGDRTEQA